MAHWTNNTVWDGAGSIAIGTLMGALAIFLIQKNRTFLIGRTVDGSVRDRLEGVLKSDPVVEEVDQMHATVTGAASSEMRAQIDFDGYELARRTLAKEDLDGTWEAINDPEQLRAYLEAFGERITDQMALEIDRLETRIQEEVPDMHQVDLEAE